MKKKKLWKQLLPRAREVIGQDQNRIRLIGAFLLTALAFAVGGLILLAFSSFEVLNWYGAKAAVLVLRWIGVALACAFWFFLAMPLWYGLKRMTGRMCDGEVIPLEELFVPFSSKREYKKALRFTSGVVLRLIGPVLLCAAGVAGIVLLYFNRAELGLTVSAFGWLTAVIAFVCSLLVILVSVLEQGGFCYLPLYLSGRSYKEARKESARAVGRSKGEVFGFRMNHLLWVLLTMGTLWIAAVIWLVPRYLVLQELYARTLLERQAERAEGTQGGEVLCGRDEHE